MKRTITFISVLGLALLMFIGSGFNQAFATTVQSNNTAESEAVSTNANTEYIEIERRYEEPSTFPNAIYYSSGGYSGTLYVKRMRTEDTTTIVTYGGYVTCSGLCPVD